MAHIPSTPLVPHISATWRSPYRLVSHLIGQRSRDALGSSRLTWCIYNISLQDCMVRSSFLHLCTIGEKEFWSCCCCIVRNNYFLHFFCLNCVVTTKTEQMMRTGAPSYSEWSLMRHNSGRERDTSEDQHLTQRKILILDVCHDSCMNRICCLCQRTKTYQHRYYHRTSALVSRI